MTTGLLLEYITRVFEILRENQFRIDFSVNNYLTPPYIELKLSQDV